jgi:hypothetical protein
VVFVVSFNQLWKGSSKVRCELTELIASCRFGLGVLLAEDPNRRFIFKKLEEALEYHNKENPRRVSSMVEGGEERRSST